MVYDLLVAVVGRLLTQLVLALIRSRYVATKEKKRSRRRNLPGMELPSIPEIDEAADDYREKRDARMRMGKEENEAADRLLKLMTEHSLSVYEYEGYKVELSALTKVKVRRKAEAENGDGEAEE